jgi:hypothetical protein
MIQRPFSVNGNTSRQSVSLRSIPMSEKRMLGRYNGVQPRLSSSFAARPLPRVFPPWFVELIMLKELSPM